VSTLSLRSTIGWASDGESGIEAGLFLRSTDMVVGGEQGGGGQETQEVG